MDLPFDGAISHFYRHKAPAGIRDAIRRADKDDIISPDYPHSGRMATKHYDKEMHRLQLELVKLQSWVKTSGSRIVVVFEGRDAAGKGGTIERFRENLNARGARVIALGTPTETERTQWYFQRYVDHLPAGGEIVFLDRSWYNRAVVEHVFGFCTAAERARFFAQVLPFEEMMANEGIRLFKIWLNVGRAEQLRRFLQRERDPLKQWKLSRIDIDGLSRWDDYSKAITETLDRTHSGAAPWTVILADDKKRARLAAIRTVLSGVDYSGKDAGAIGGIDSDICGGPEIWKG